jgi:hypothetical protein
VSARPVAAARKANNGGEIWDGSCLRTCCGWVFNHSRAPGKRGGGPPESKQPLSNSSGLGYFIAMSTVQEIEAAIPRLSRNEVEEVRAWIDDFLEDQLELTDEVKAKLDQSHREIAEGHYTTRQPK